MTEDTSALILLTHGVDEPNRTYAPLFYATFAGAMELEATMWFTMDGTSQMAKGAAEEVQIEASTDVTLQTMIDRALAAVEIIGCHRCMGCSTSWMTTSSTRRRSLGGQHHRSGPRRRRGDVLLGDPTSTRTTSTQLRYPD